MKRTMGFLLLLGSVSVACSQPGPSGTDLGVPPDQAMMQDQAAMPHIGPLSMLTLVAGAIGGPGTADGIGAEARFDGPWGVAADGAGNLYVADDSSATIRQVVLATGAVTTLAGSSYLTGSADGSGIAARFDSPLAVAADGAGNLYVADSGNNAIRKVVVATGVVTTVAGMAGQFGSADATGAAARFNSPRGIAVDGAGNLYVVDSGNHTIRKIVLATGMVTTLAGTAGMAGSTDGTGPAARFSLPNQVAVDGSGNLNGDYVSAYINWLTTTCRSRNHEYSIYSAGRQASAARSAA